MIERELRLYLLSTNPIKEVVGTHVYAGRIPRTANPTHSILLRTLSADRFYHLQGEENFVQTIVTFDLLTRSTSGEVTLNKLFQYCRKALNKYAAAPSQMGETFVNSVNIISEAVNVPQPPIASGHGWKRQRSFDVQITYEQETEFA